MVRLGVDEEQRLLVGLAYFNSTMVRLGEYAVRSLYASALYFNSTMVRLGALGCFLLLNSIIHFNSTMVRLGARKQIEYIAKWIKFQFHYGSIGRRNERLLWLLFFLISIPLWFDWEGGQLIARVVGSEISIPLWFDWELLRYLLYISIHFHFNSTMVRLGVYSI